MTENGTENATELVRVSPSARHRVESVKAHDRETFNDCLVRVLEMAKVAAA